MTEHARARASRCRPPPVTPPSARPLPSRRTTSPISVSRTKASAASNGPSGRCPSCASSASASTRERPLAGLRIAACLHVTTETANLMRTLKAGGAEVTLDGVQPALHQGRRGGRPRGALRHQHLRHPRRGQRHLLPPPQRGRGHAPAHHHGRRLRPRGAAPPGAARPAGRGPGGHGGDHHRASSASRPWPPTAPWRFPVVAVNEAQTKHLFDNRYGTGQSTVDGILRATNILLAGRRCVVAGYGWVGRGIASRLRRHGRPGDGGGGRPGARHRGAHGRPPGHDRGDAARWGEVFVTATGNLNVFREEHFRVMPDGARPGQQRPLRRRAGPQGPRRAWPRATSARCARTSGSTTWARRSSTCWPRAASSTWAPPRATRPPSWT